MNDDDREFDDVITFVGFVGPFELLPFILLLFDPVTVEESLKKLIYYRIKKFFI